MEVNPNHRQRTNQKLNVIDARFIDTHSGLFIDITGLSNLKNDLSDDPLLSCKSPHDYHYSYIFPLVRTEFEGVLSWRPFHVEKSLLDEYSTRSITDEYYKVMILLIRITVSLTQRMNGSKLKDALVFIMHLFFQRS